MASEKEMIKTNINIENKQIIKYEDECLKLYNLLMITKISVVTLFHNNANIINIIRNNIGILNLEKNYKFTFYLIDNNSNDDTYEELCNINSIYDNIKIFKNSTNGC